MTRIVIAVASALALIAGSALANNDKTDKTASTTPTAGAPSASAESVSGEVKSTDPATNVVTVALPSGDEQKLSVDKDAQITRDGSTASISQLQPGDSVRASFDTKTNKASKLDVKSKSGAKKDSTQPEPKKM
jgi:Cu/Ag efflux protein CusF